MVGHQLSISVFASTLRKTNLLVLFAFLGGSVFGQEVALRIEFEGNQRTKSSFLLQVMDVDTMNFDEYELEMGLQRLKNLPILVGASMEVDADRQTVVVRVKVVEGAVIWPLVSFGGVEGNQWFLVGLSDFNTGGRAIQTTAFYRNIDGEHNGFFSISAPYIRGNAFGGGIEVQRYAAIEPLFFGALSEGVDYLYENITLGGHVSYAFDYQHRLRIGVSYLEEDYTSLQETDPLSSFAFPQLASKQKYLIKASHDYNRVNFHGFEREGWSYFQQLQVINDLGNYKNPFMMYWMETRFFKRFVPVNINLAMRGRIGVSSNEVNPFAPFVLDSQQNIRGAGNRVERGTAVAVLNTELRFTALDTKYFAGQVVGFSDLGNWRKPGGVINDLLYAQNLQHFAGMGIRLIYKRSQLATLRVDYGVNTQNREQRGLVIGVGQYF